MATGLNQSSEQLQGATSGVPKQSGDLQIEQPDTRTSEQKSPTKRRIFTATKEDPALIEQMKPEDSREMFSGVDAMIDGYYRINKRRYGSRGQYRAR
jgi:hypothetical protein